jgi:hypothetical protein
MKSYYELRELCGRQRIKLIEDHIVLAMRFNEKHVYLDHKKLDEYEKMELLGAGFKFRETTRPLTSDITIDCVEIYWE